MAIMNQNQLNLDFSRRLRDEGIDRAILNAEYKDPEWPVCAYGYLKRFLAFNDDSFMAEDVRVYAETQGLSRPPSKRAWGAVVLKAAKQKLIRKVGYGQTKNPLAHGTPASLWVRN